MRGQILFRAVLAALLVAATGVAAARAQDTSPADGSPSDALSDALAAACRQDAPGFARDLTTRNAAAMQQLPAAERTALLRRFILLDNPGKPLLSTSDTGHPVMRCEAAGLVSEMRFGATQVDANLAFIPVQVPDGTGQTRSVRFGMVREGHGWKLLSVGLLLLDLPAMEQQWKQADFDARETDAIASMHKIAGALKNYQRAYGHLPDSLEQLGPAPAEGISPERAGLLGAALALGDDGDYHFRYTIVPSASGGDASERDKSSSFVLAATPDTYGKSGLRSFYLDASGVLHGADKHGAVATAEDPTLPAAQP
jgi:hypothetical protein